MVPRPVARSAENEHRGNVHAASAEETLNFCAQRRERECEKGYSVARPLRPLFPCSGPTDQSARSPHHRHVGGTGRNRPTHGTEALDAETSPLRIGMRMAPMDRGQDAIEALLREAIAEQSRPGSRQKRADVLLPLCL